MFNLGCFETYYQIVCSFSSNYCLIEDTESIEHNMDIPLSFIVIFVFLIFYNLGNTIDYST